MSTTLHPLQTSPYRTAPDVILPLMRNQGDLPRLTNAFNVMTTADDEPLISGPIGSSGVLSKDDLMDETKNINHHELEKAYRAKFTHWGQDINAKGRSGTLKSRDFVRFDNGYGIRQTHQNEGITHHGLTSFHYD